MRSAPGAVPTRTAKVPARDRTSGARTGAGSISTTSRVPLQAQLLLSLQSSVGNRAVSRLVEQRIQPLSLQSSVGNRAVSRLAEQRIQRELLPVSRHREVVVDAAKRLEKDSKDPATASESQWFHAIYEELEGEGNPSADKCAEKLVEQHIIDMNDWNRIVADYKEYKKSKGKGFDLFERHAMPEIHNEDTANKWVSSLITHRIDDLYLTVAGFTGHAQQVQQGITRIVGAFEEGKFKEDAYKKFKTAIVDGLKHGRSKTQLAIPKYVYTFEKGSTVSIG